MSLHFEDANRQIALKIAVGDGESLFSLGSLYYIKFRYSDIQCILIDRNSDIHKVLFRLRTPVSYEHSQGELLNQFANLFGGAKGPTRTRLSSLELDEKHADLAKYISRNVLVRLGKPAASEFLRLAKVARLPVPHRTSLSIAKSEIFASSNTAELRRWISQHTWEVAFQVSVRLLLTSDTDYMHHSLSGSCPTCSSARKNSLPYARILKTSCGPPKRNTSLRSFWTLSAGSKFWIETTKNKTKARGPSPSVCGMP
jgi:hypothetical protein